MKIRLPHDLAKLGSLKAGDEVELSGTVYTARDQAHKRIAGMIKSRKKTPFPLKGSVIYYCGPAGTPRGAVIGSCGPTTSRRMDGFAPLLLSAGVKAMIGKGSRSGRVRDAIRAGKAVYFTAYPGCGALMAGFVVSRKLCAFGELGPEAVYRLEVKDMPLVVAIDSKGRSVSPRFVY
jgi:fumarate hydratase subunit beta